MPYHYSDPERENDPDALPDVEVFESLDSREANPDLSDDEFYAAQGWYFAFGFPGCLWDSDPIGPFDTEAEALDAAREV